MVEWRKIGEVCKTITPPKKLRTVTYQDIGLYPIIDQGQNAIVGYTDDETALLPKDEYVLFGDHTRFVKYFKGRFAQGADGLKILKAKESITPQYFFYAFDNIEVPTRGYSRHWSIAKELLIPVPSIAEQHRIVDILDTFTAAIDNLKQQIEKRRKQYEYYRDQLLDLEGKEGVEMKKLGDVLVSLKTGLNPRKNFVLNSPGSKNFYITVRELGHYNITPTDKTDMVTDEALRLINNRSNLEKGDVLFSGTGTIGRTALVKEKPNNWNIKEGVYTLKPIQSVISSKFLIELLHTNPIMDKMNSFIVGDPIRSVPMKSLVLVSIPVPSLEEQSRIVGILDTFEASIANLEQQLEMREKQYEYYRNKLLDFE